jgi:hypothetical protein
MLSGGCVIVICTCHAELVSASIPPNRPSVQTEKWTLK